MLQSHLQELRKAERRAHEAIQSAARKAQNHSLIELIRSKVPSYTGPRDMSAAHAVYDVNSEVERIAGAPNGCWVPLSLMTRDLTTTSASAVIGNNMQSTIAQALAPASIVISSGASVVSTVQAGALRLPVFSQAADASGGWTNEGSTYVVAEPQFGQVVIEPKTIAVKLQISRRLLTNATPDIEREIRRHLFEALMRAVDKAAIAGSGTGNEPLGLLNHPDVPVVAGGTNGAAPTWDHVTQLEYEVASRNGRIENGAFVMSAEVLRKLRRTPRGSGLGYIMENDSRLLGHPVRVSSHVPSNLVKGTGTNLSAIVLGNWGDLLLAIWNAGAVDLLVDGVTQIRNGWIVLTARLDAGVSPLHPQSFAKMTDIVTT
jgi:HK97 family phage major capsid protein